MTTLRENLAKHFNYTGDRVEEVCQHQIIKDIFDTKNINYSHEYVLQCGRRLDFYLKLEQVALIIEAQVDACDKDHLYKSEVYIDEIHRRNKDKKLAYVHVAASYSEEDKAWARNHCSDWCIIMLYEMNPNTFKLSKVNLYAETIEEVAKIIEKNDIMLQDIQRARIEELNRRNYHYNFVNPDQSNGLGGSIGLPKRKNNFKAKSIGGIELNRDGITVVAAGNYSIDYIYSKAKNNFPNYEITRAAKSMKCKFIDKYNAKEVIDFAETFIKSFE